MVSGCESSSMDGPTALALDAWVRFFLTIGGSGRVSGLGKKKLIMASEDQKYRLMCPGSEERD